MSGLKHGAAIYPCIRCLKSKHDIRELKVRPAQIAHEMDEVRKSYRHQYTVYGKTLEKKRKEKLRQNWDEFESTLNF